MNSYIIVFTIVSFIATWSLFSLFARYRFIKEGRRWQKNPLNDPWACVMAGLAIVLPFFFPATIRQKAGIILWAVVIAIHLGRIGWKTGLLNQDSDAKTMPDFDGELFQRQQESIAQEKEGQPPPDNQEQYLDRLKDKTL